jgi:hypothetical protein
MKVAIFWGVTSCSLVDIYQNFGGTHCQKLQTCMLKMQVVFSSKESVNFCQIMWCHNPEDCNHLLEKEIVWKGTETCLRSCVYTICNASGTKLKYAINVPVTSVRTYFGDV